MCIRDSLKGCMEARRIIRKLQPDVVFSKGGFVSVPVVLAAAHYKIPVILHESDMTPGLANRICIPSARKVCCNFPETLSHLPKQKAVLTGSPIRQELLTGDAVKALRFTGLTPDRPVLLSLIHIFQFFFSFRIHSISHPPFPFFMDSIC